MINICSIMREPLRIEEGFYHKTKIHKGLVVIFDWPDRNGLHYKFWGTV